MKKYYLLCLLASFFLIVSCGETTSENGNTSTAESAVKSNVEETSEQSGNTYLYTFKLTADGMEGMGSDTKLYVSDYGMRSEMSMKVMGREMKLVTMALKSNPEQSIILNEE